ncbi:T-complex protein 1 subunit delta [Ananas comosus]|uniref:T-complex protein 1 subunit delta n=1 Tax=Ananas comosus TaxID=4615 RepID=A0A6P5FNF4_ANACO|nr:T-complex protein 1 subunit delta [Ananas comosus]
MAAATAAAAAASASSSARKGETYTDTKRRDDVRMANILAARAVADAVRTSLGPRGMDKMIASASSGDVVITNDGATILQRMSLLQPAARMLVDLSRSQDSAAGDGTTSVVVLAGSLLRRSLSLLSSGLHPTSLSDALHRLSLRAVDALHAMSIPLDLSDRGSLVKSAATALSSKVVSQYSSLLAPIAVDAVLAALDPAHPDLVDLRDVRVVKKLGGTVDDTELVRGLVFDKKASHAAGGPTRVENAKIAVVQFQISPPKTDIEQSVVVSDYAQMDRILREERNYILGMVKKIKATGCNVLLIQKSILRDAVTDLSLHYLAKAKILVVKDVERDDIEFITKTLNCLPIANIEHFREDKLGHADLVEEVPVGDGRIVKITGIKDMGRTATVLVRGSNLLVIDEAERSLHDALCVVRCLVKKRFLIAGGGAPEIEMSMQLAAWAKELQGAESYCIKEFAEALEVIPYTLAENAGLNPIAIVTELRNQHAKGEINAGINVRKGQITNMLEENVVQPLLVSTSAITLATEFVRMILKIDDIVTVR